MLAADSDDVMAVRFDDVDDDDAMCRGDVRTSVLQSVLYNHHQCRSLPRTCKLLTADCCLARCQMQETHL